MVILAVEPAKSGGPCRVIPGLPVPIRLQIRQPFIDLGGETRFALRAVTDDVDA